MSSVLRKLTPEMRRALRTALDGGRLTAPFNEHSLRPHVPTLSQELSKELERLVAVGMTAPLLSEMLALLDHPSPTAPRLVWTGPEDTADMRDTGVVVRELFGNAERHALVAGFAVYQGRAVFEELARRMDQRPDLMVDMYLNVDRPYGNGATADELLLEFAREFREQQWPGERVPAVFYDPRALDVFEPGAKRAALHAKCIIVDHEHVLVTSANFTEAAQERNIEVGVLLRDGHLAAGLKLQFDRLLNRKLLRRVPGL